MSLQKPIKALIIAVTTIYSTKFWRGEIWQICLQSPNFALQNFQHKRGDELGGNTLSQATLLPDPDSSLNKVAPSVLSAIAKVNEIVTPILPAATNTHLFLNGHTGERGPYMKPMLAHHYEIGKMQNRFINLLF